MKGRLGVTRELTLLTQARAAFYAGESQKAREYCLSILQRAPRNAHALSLMAAIAADMRQLEEGMTWAASAMAADPESAEPHYVLGRLRDLAGQQAEAEASYRKAILLQPGHAKAHNNLGCVLRLVGRFDEALGCFRRALELDPEQPEANQNLAAMTSDSAARQLAIEGYLRQIAADPTDARALNNLANIYYGAGQLHEAAELLDRVIALDPGRAEAHYSKALVLLTAGNYADGWKEYAWRWRINNELGAPMRRFETAAWDGSKVAGPVLLHGELPFGESLLFVRYAPMVAERCEGVIFECEAPLKTLLQSVEGVRWVTTPGETLPSFSAHIPLSALPGLFGTTLANIPWRGPYIHAQGARIDEWRRTLPSRRLEEIRVGVVWTGNPRNTNNHERSIALEKLAALQHVPGIALYSLQKGASPASAGCPGMNLIDFTSRIRDFADTAALVSCLDLVVTVDTAVAHLAGAMGVPVWVMINHVADWRYPLERSDTPWYPTMRLYRQKRENDWTEVVDRVAADLRLLRVRS